MCRQASPERACLTPSSPADPSAQYFEGQCLHSAALRGSPVTPLMVRPAKITPVPLRLSPQGRTCPTAAPWTPSTTSQPSAPASPSRRSSREAAAEIFSSPWTCSGSSCTWSAAEEIPLRRKECKNPQDGFERINLVRLCLSNRSNSLCPSRF